MDSKDVAKVKELWGESSGRWGSAQWLRWLQHPNVQERINELVTGEQGRDRFHYLIEKSALPKHADTGHRVRRALTLGCGHGEFERGVAQYDLAEIHDACDIADGAVSAAARMAREAGSLISDIEWPTSILFSCLEVTTMWCLASPPFITLPVLNTCSPKSSNPEPGGYFVLDEFIGPSKFQWTDEQLDAINTELQRIPTEFTRRLVAPFTPKGAVRRPSIAEMNAVDPSEAARSGEILDVLAGFFDIVEFRGYGGSLLHLLLDEIAGRFMPNNPQAMSHLATVSSWKIASSPPAHFDTTSL